MFFRPTFSSARATGAIEGLRLFQNDLPRRVDTVGDDAEVTRPGKDERAAGRPGQVYKP